jgi:hypothetical protein
MTKITAEHIDVIYDATTFMRLASQILSEGEVDDEKAGEISWLLGSLEKRLEPIIPVLEEAQSDQDALACKPSAALISAIAVADRTHAAWTNLGYVDGEMPENTHEEAAFDMAEKALITFPCRTIADVKARSEWLMAKDATPAARLTLSSIETNFLTEFMRSLLGLPSETQQVLP